MIDWKFIGTQILWIMGVVICGFISLGLAALFIKAWGGLY